MMTSLPKDYRALVLGASGALGAAFVSQLQADACCAQVIGLSRHSTPALVLEDEASVRDCGAWLASHTPLHLVIDATGALSLDGRGPEKRLDELDPQHLARAMAVNAIGPALVMKHALRLMPRERRQRTSSTVPCTATLASASTSATSSGGARNQPVPGDHSVAPIHTAVTAVAMMTTTSPNAMRAPLGSGLPGSGITSRSIQ